MTPREIKHFYFEKTNFSPDAVKAREGHRYLAMSRVGEQHPAGNCPQLAVFDAERAKFLSPTEAAALPFSDAMEGKRG